MSIGELRTDESREMDGEQLNKRKLGSIKSESWRVGGGRRCGRRIRKVLAVTRYGKR
jgi:hypothetical protein